jgi:hypothetical protein
VSLATFSYALYDEFLPHAHNAALALSCDVLPVSDFARTLLLSPRKSKSIAASRARINSWRNTDAPYDSSSATSTR